MAGRRGRITLGRSRSGVSICRAWEECGCLASEGRQLCREPECGGGARPSADRSRAGRLPDLLLAGGRQGPQLRGRWTRPAAGAGGSVQPCVGNGAGARSSVRFFTGRRGILTPSSGWCATFARHRLGVAEGAAGIPGCPASGVGLPGMRRPKGALTTGGEGLLFSARSRSRGATAATAAAEPAARPDAACRGRHRPQVGFRSAAGAEGGTGQAARRLGAGGSLGRGGMDPQCMRRAVSRIEHPPYVGFLACRGTRRLGGEGDASRRQAETENFAGVD